MPNHRYDSHRRDSERDDGAGRLSIVVPARDEASNLPELLAEIAQWFRPLTKLRADGPRLLGFEVVIVDDGSTDGTTETLKRLQFQYPELRTIRLRSNVGQSAATVAGFREATGEWVAVLDADLQNRPEDLATLWDALPGHDAALGWRIKREDVWSKRVISRWANRVRNRVLGQSIRDTGCSVRIFRREMALRLPTFHGSHRFFGPTPAPRGLPGRAGPGHASAASPGEVALPFLESFDPSRGRPARGRLALAAADPLRGRLARMHGPGKIPTGCVDRFSVAFEPAGGGLTWAWARRPG